MIYHWQTAGMRYDRRFFVYLLALVSTMSTAGYLAIFIVLFAFYVKKITFWNIAMLIAVNLLFMLYIYKLDFVGGEIGTYIENYQSKTNLQYSSKYKAAKVSRFKIVDYDIEKVIKYPFGYGVVSKKDYSKDMDIVGVNGITSLLVMWGVPLFIYVLLLFRRYIYLINFSNNNKLTSNLLFVGLLIMFFSNPIARNTFIYFIALTPLLFKNTVVNNDR
jgi:Ca2+/Na+ antiporter